MNRRAFMQFFAAVAVVATATVRWFRHKLYPDGETDNTDAFQAYLDGEIIEGPNGEALQRVYDPETDKYTIHIPAGTYRVTGLQHEHSLIVQGKGARKTTMRYTSK